MAKGSPSGCNAQRSRLPVFAHLFGEQRHQAPILDIAVGHEAGQAGDALVAQGQLAERLAAGGRDIRLDLQAIAVGVHHRPAVEMLGLGEAEQGVPSQPLDARRRAVAGQVLRAGEDVQAAGAQRPRVQGGVAERTDADRHVGALLQQVDDQVVGVEFELDVRVQPAELADVRHHRVQHEGRGGVDPQAPGGALPAQGQAFLERLHLLQDLPCLVEEVAAFLGQLHAPGGAVEQGGAELVLEAREGPADGRGGQSHLFRGGADGTAVDYTDEALQFIGVGFHS